MSNYPPGVTGNEWEIAGYPPCGRNGCGHPDDEHFDNGRGDGGCMLCVCEGYTPYGEGPDPDALYDKERDDAATVHRGA